MPTSIMSDFDRLKSWSRHHQCSTPANMKEVWTTSYQNSFNSKKLGYNPDRVIIDYFSGRRSVIPSRQDFKRESMRTSLNERAKEGFRYWMLDKNKSTYFGRYGTGAYKSVLGIGNAPRT